MRSRPPAAILLALAFSAAACQFIWSYDNFKEPGTGGGGGAPSSSTRSSSGAPSSSSSSSGGSTSTGTTSSSSGDAGCAGGPFGMACTECCDQMAIAARQGSIQGDVYGCTYPGNLGNQSGARACIAMKDGLSMGCADCWAAEGQCGYQKCWPQCVGGVSAPCNSCLAANCDAAFTMCSGVSRSGPMDGGADAPCH